MASKIHARLQRELRSILKDVDTLREQVPECCVYVDETDARLWRIAFQGPEESVYAGESYMIMFRFPDTYPLQPPDVRFAVRDGENKPCVVPMHEHVYGNGDVCMSVLHTDWVPALGVRGILLSVVSMLASAEEKKRPPNEAHYLRTYRYIQNTKWEFDDANC